MVGAGLNAPLGGAGGSHDGEEGESWRCSRKDGCNTGDSVCEGPIWTFADLNDLKPVRKKSNSST